MHFNDVEVMIEQSSTPPPVEDMDVLGADIDVRYVPVLAGAFSSTPKSPKELARGIEHRDLGLPPAFGDMNSPATIHRNHRIEGDLMKSGPVEPPDGRHGVERDHTGAAGHLTRYGDGILRRQARRRGVNRQQTKPQDAGTRESREVLCHRHPSTNHRGRPVPQRWPQQHSEGSDPPESAPRSSLRRSL